MLTLLLRRHARMMYKASEPADPSFKCTSTAVQGWEVQGAAGNDLGGWQVWTCRRESEHVAASSPGC